MTYETLYEEKWESKGVKGYTRLQKITETAVHKEGDLAIRQSLTKENIRYNAVVLFPSYNLIKACIDALLLHHGKKEVEKELGIKIKEVKRPHGGR